MSLLIEFKSELIMKKGEMCKLLKTEGTTCIYLPVFGVMQCLLLTISDVNT